MQKMTKKTPLVFHIGIALLCLVLFSAHLTSGLYARYTSEASSQDSARVAKFDVTNSVDSQNANIDLHFYDSTKLVDEFNFTVESKSEVAVAYDVVITLPAGTYKWLSIQLDGKEANSIENNVFIFEDVNTFLPATSVSKVHTLSFSIQSAYVGNSQGIQDIIGGKAVVTVHAEQQD